MFESNRPIKLPTPRSIIIYSVNPTVVFGRECVINIHVWTRAIKLIAFDSLCVFPAVFNAVCKISNGREWKKFVLIFTASCTSRWCKYWNLVTILWPFSRLVSPVIMGYLIFYRRLFYIWICNFTNGKL